MSPAERQARIERARRFAKWSSCVQRARDEFNVAADGSDRFRDSAFTKAERLAIYWKKVNKRARQLFGGPMPRGYKTLKGGLWTGGLKTGGLK